MNEKGLKALRVTLGIFVVFLGARVFTQSGVLGSVAPGGEYSSVTITSSNASNASTTVVKGGSGTLGSIVINTTNGPAVFEVYDSIAATSTGLTAIAKFAATSTVGTYTYDISVRNGIMVVAKSGFVGNFTIT